MIRMISILFLGLSAPCLAVAGEQSARTAEQAYKQGEYREAIQKFAREGISDSDLESRIKVARSYHVTGESKRAFELAEAVLAKSPGQTDALVLLGDMYARQGDWQAATAHYIEATKSDSPNAEIWLRLAQAWQAQGETLMAEVAMSGYRTFKSH